MPIFYMLIACVAGCLASFAWVATGGTMPSALAVYVLIGNLMVIGLIARVARRALPARA